MKQVRDNQQKGFKNLFLQISQLKNFLLFVGGGGLFIPLYADVNAWPRVQTLFTIWISLSIFWFLLILFIYKGELENRVLGYITSIAKRIIPLAVIALSLYLILWPFDVRKMLGLLILIVTYFFFSRKTGLIGISVENSSKANKKTTSWIATETNNEQGTDFREISLEGKSAKEIEFKVKPYSHFWRAGLKITDPNGFILPLRTPNSVLFHVGSVENNDDKFGITAYVNGEWVSDVNKILDIPKDGYIKIRFEVNEKNFVKCFINDNLEFQPKERVDSRMMEKAYLAAWGDGNPYRVEFCNIKYKFRD